MHVIACFLPPYIMDLNVNSLQTKIPLCDSLPCQHNGSCENGPDSDTYECTCTYPWTGVNCDTEINFCANGTECQNGGTCLSTSDGFICQYEYMAVSLLIFKVAKNPCIGPLRFFSIYHGYAKDIFYDPPHRRLRVCSFCPVCPLFPVCPFLCFSDYLFDCTKLLHWP